MNLLLVGQILVLVSVANGAPVLAKLVVRDRFARPIDQGGEFTDGRPLLGPSKTYRGVIASLVATTAAAPLVGISWKLGLLAAAATMTGDLAASFTKRRLGIASSEMALGLDQIPESLLPAIALMPFLGLSVWEIAAVTAIFSIGTPIVSPLLFRLGIRDRPH